MVTIIYAILVIWFVVVIHELGHFLVARWCGVKVHKFSIGFGKALLSYRSKRSGTEYVLAILPLGGYVKMLSLEEKGISEADKPLALESQPIWQRVFIVLAGPVMNFVLAVLLFAMVFLHGVTTIKPVVGQVIANSIAAQAGIQPSQEIVAVAGQHTPSWQRVIVALISAIGSDGNLRMRLRTPSGELINRDLDIDQWRVQRRQPQFLKSLGIIPWSPATLPVIAKIMPNSPASKAGLQVNDRIIALAKKPTPTLHALSQAIHQHVGQEVMLTLRRDGERYRVKLHLKKRLGVQLKPPVWPKEKLVKKQFNLFSTWLPAFEQTWWLIRFNAIVLVKLVLGKLSLFNLGGPISIVRYAGAASQVGWLALFGFMAFISVALGFVNLLPIPVLDGGHLIFYVFELICGRPMSRRWQEIWFRVGLLFLVFLMLQATLNDLIRLFSH